MIPVRTESLSDTIDGALFGKGKSAMDDGTVVGRALEIVECIAALGPGVSLADLSARTHISKPTARRIAQDLVRRQVLVRLTSGYALGPTLSRVGRIAALQQDFASAHQHLEELHGACGGLSWLVVEEQQGTLHPFDLVCRDDMASLVADKWPTGPAAEVLVNTAMGRLILADRPDLVEQVHRQGLRRSTPHSPSSRQQLDAILHQVRDLGAAAESEQCMLGWQCVATKFTPPSGGAAVLGVTVPAQSGDPRRMLRATMRAADALAAAVTASQRGALPVRSVQVPPQRAVQERRVP